MILWVLYMAILQSYLLPSHVLGPFNKPHCMSSVHSTILDCMSSVYSTSLHSMSSVLSTSPNCMVGHQAYTRNGQAHGSDTQRVALPLNLRNLPSHLDVDVSSHNTSLPVHRRVHQ